MHNSVTISLSEIKTTVHCTLMDVLLHGTCFDLLVDLVGDMLSSTCFIALDFVRELS